MTTLSSVFDRLETLIAKRAPNLVEVWPEPATTDELGAAAEALGRPLPAELEALLRIHNGSDEQYVLFARWDLLSTETIVSEHKLNIEAIDDWDATCTPFAGDGSGNFLVVDSSGAVREAANDGEPWEVHSAGSITELLSRFADELEGIG